MNKLGLKPPSGTDWVAHSFGTVCTQLLRRQSHRLRTTLMQLCPQPVVSQALEAHYIVSFGRFATGIFCLTKAEGKQALDGEKSPCGGKILKVFCEESKRPCHTRLSSLLTAGSRARQGVSASRNRGKRGLGTRFAAYAICARNLFQSNAGPGSVLRPGAISECPAVSSMP